ncbi:hypothetical protein RIF29_06636 [Crotalaria pallida]|uniref:non-specific serine/threonine protein kinase n=1 Tax=Crotalaria pallida TaxID=3830 RepID=A0AAN9PBN0_CROPI
MSAAPAPSSLPPPANSTAPPPATHSTPPAPPPKTPSTPPAPPPETPSPPPKATPATPPAPPPETPATPSPPPAETPPSTTPPSVSPPPPSTGTHPAPPSKTTPPPPHHPPHAPRTPSSASSSSSSSSSINISSKVLVGIGIAGAVAVVLVLMLVWWLCCIKKKKKRRRYDEQHFYPPLPPHQPKVDQYSGSRYQWQHDAPPPPDHVVQAVPQPSPAPPSIASNTPSSPYAPAKPPPAPPFINSSDGSGSNYSAGGTPLPPPSPGLSLSFSQSTFTYEDLVRATDGFSDANLLGSGGFGYVHRGVLPNGKEVAIKQLKAGSGQGEKEFKAEVEIISRVHHKHLVCLVGFCITGTHRLLVYEFVPNNTLEFHLHGKGRPTMDWPSRLKIALGAAKGIAYLHEDCHPKIIHRDIKAANILLDFRFEAKVSDFGLAKIASDFNTHVSTRVMGTFGYLAPEYAATGKLTDKSDVFSYGIMLLELITGRRPVEKNANYAEDSLVDWARPMLTRALEEDNFDSLVDPRLQNEFDPNELARMVACASACIRHSAKRRPSMSKIVRALEGDVTLADLNEGIRAANYSSYGSTDFDSAQHKDEMKKFRKTAFGETQEYGASSGYSAPTSEYGLYPSGSSSEAQSLQTTREMEMKMMNKSSKGFNGTS